MLETTGLSDPSGIPSLAMLLETCPDLGAVLARQGVCLCLARLTCRVAADTIPAPTCWVFIYSAAKHLTEKYSDSLADYERITRRTDGPHLCVYGDSTDAQYWKEYPCGFDLVSGRPRSPAEKKNRNSPAPEKTGEDEKARGASEDEPEEIEKSEEPKNPYCDVAYYFNTPIGRNRKSFLCFHKVCGLILGRICPREYVLALPEFPGLLAGEVLADDDYIAVIQASFPADSLSGLMAVTSTARHVELAYESRGEEILEKIQTQLECVIDNNLGTSDDKSMFGLYKLVTGVYPWYLQERCAQYLADQSRGLAGSSEELTEPEESQESEESREVTICYEKIYDRRNTHII